MNIKEDLHQGRIVSIDALRGITIFTMIFVNELAGVTEIPGWMKHMPADADGMTFVDLVFPGFLFIVGMSIPFSFNARLRKGEPPLTIWRHTLWRTLALLIMGLFMVNIEYGYDAEAMVIPSALWGLLAYSLPILVWNQYPKEWSPRLKYGLQITGLMIFLILHLLYVQDGGERGMTVKWWGILGLIGWAYLYSVIAYWFGKGRLLIMLLFLVVCVGINTLNSAGVTTGWLGGNWGYIGSHFSHASIVMAGLVVSLLYFDKKETGPDWKYGGFVILLFAIGYLLRPYFGVSKIGATPSWCLYSAGLCAIIYSFLYWLMEQKGKVSWASFFMPAARDPLLIYILPGILIYLSYLLGVWYRPEFMGSGLLGIAYTIVFSIIMLYLVKLLNRVGVKLRL